MLRPEQSAGVGRGRDDRRDPRVELRAPVRLRRRDLGQFVVAGGERDADELGLVGHVDREQRQDRGALILAEGAQPSVRGPGIAGGHRLQGEEPCRLAAEVWRGVLEQAPGESGRSLLQASVALMQRDSPQGDDARGVKGADEAIAGLRAELPVEDRPGVVEPAQLVQLSAAPDLEDADGPAVSVALGRRDAVGGQAQRVIHVVQHGARLAAPLLGEVARAPSRSCRCRRAPPARSSRARPRSARRRRR